MTRVSMEVLGVERCEKTYEEPKRGEENAEHERVEAWVPPTALPETKRTDQPLRFHLSPLFWRDALTLGNQGLPVFAVPSFLYSTTLRGGGVLSSRRK